MGEVPGETLEARIAAELGEAGERRPLERKPLRLLVVDHLQAVFDAAQEDIGLAQIVDSLGADPFVGMKAPAACRACARRASGDGVRRK